MSEHRIPRVAWFTPLRPIASGISFYNEELLPLLAGSWSIDVFVDGYRPTHLGEIPSLRVLPARRFRRLDRHEPYDAVVYQMGNSPAHAYMYDIALSRPGVLVLHDTVLHHLVLSMLLTRRGGSRYRELMWRRYGSRGVEAAERVLRGQLPDDLFAFPLSEDLIAASRCVVVHSEHSRRQVEALVPGAAVTTVPMGVRLPPLVERAAARAVLGLPEDAFILASITHVNPYKRLDVVLRALRRLRERRPALLVVAGSVSPQVPLDRLVELLDLDDVVDRRGFVTDAEARLIAAAADACVNLRYPTAGETSASLLRLMGAGRPVLVSDAGAFSELPDGAVAKVPVDVLEAETVLALLDALADRPELATAMGRSARRFIEVEHSLPRMALAYHRLLEAATGATRPEPPASVPEETIDLTSLAPPPKPDATVGAVAAALGELGLGGDRELVAAAARAMVELGLGAGTMGPVIGAEEELQMMSSNEAKPISDDLLEILACPACKAPVHLEDGKLVCEQCGRRYRIEDGIPIMLIDEAELPGQP